MRAFLLTLLLGVSAAAREADVAPSAAPAPAAPEIALTPLEPGAWVVTQFRPWPANALLVESSGGELVLVDTLYTPAAMRELFAWIERKLPGRRLLAINTHFHSDRAGGNAFLKEKKIPIYASDATIKLMRTRGRAVMEGVANAIGDVEQRAAFLAAPIAPADGVFSLERGLKLTVGGDALEVSFPGPGHSSDNLVVWFPGRKILFGGCLVVSTGRLGNTSDADVKAWARSASALSAYPARWVIPGHGSIFDPALVTRTVETLGKRAAP